MALNRADADAAIAAAATSYTASLFLGRAQYDTVRSLHTLEAARAAGKALVAKHSNGRPAMLYAVTEAGASTHLENVA